MSDNPGSSPQRRPGAILLLVATSYLLAFALRVSVVPFYPTFMARWDASYAQLGGLMTAFFLTYASTQIPAGFLADRLDNRRMLASGALLMALAGLGSGLARTLTEAVGYRALLGLGAAVTYTSGFRLLANAYPGSQRAFALGTMEAAGGVGMLLSLTVLPLLAERLGPAAFCGALSLGLVPVAAASLGTPAGHTARTTTGGALCRNRLSVKLVPVLLIGFLGMVAIYGVLTWTPTFLERLGATPPRLALVMGFLVVGFTLGAPAAGHLSDHLGNRPAVVAAGSSLMAVLLLLQATFPKLSWQPILAPLLGGAMGLAMAPLLALSAEVLGPQAAGSAVGLTLASAQLGSALAGWGLGWIIDHAGSFAAVWGICAACTVLRALVAATVANAPTGTGDCALR